jgi:2-dehydro-3-deoxy-D-gluconate 5-dehydrogenase
MVKRREGKIINIASMYSFFGSGFIPSYSAAKGALVQLTKSMAIELAPFNIQVNAIAPGWTETDMTARITTAASGSPQELLYQEIIRRTPAARFANPDEYAGTAIYLASRAADFVTGATICVDGGLLHPVNPAEACQIESNDSSHSVVPFWTYSRFREEVVPDSGAFIQPAHQNPKR